MTSPEVVVIDYGVGNLLSVQRGLEHCGARVITTGNQVLILAASRLVLPGVGAFANAMEALHQLGLVPVIRKAAQAGTPLLGICLGMQLLLDESEEFGRTQGLGLIAGKVTAIPDRSNNNEPLKIPHVGWNELLPAGADWNDTVLSRTRPGEPMYFVHSFVSRVDDEAQRLADCLYGGHRLAAVIKHGNITGCQFHPEKSGEAGLTLLRQFLLQ